MLHNCDWVGPHDNAWMNVFELVTVMDNQSVWDGAALAFPHLKKDYTTIINIKLFKVGLDILTGETVTQLLVPSFTWWMWMMWILPRISAGEFNSLPKYTTAPSLPYWDPLQKNWFRFHVSPCELHNVTYQSSGTVDDLREEHGQGTVSSNLQGYDPERDPSWSSSVKMKFSTVYRGPANKTPHTGPLIMRIISWPRKELNTCQCGQERSRAKSNEQARKAAKRIGLE